MFSTSGLGIVPFSAVLGWCEFKRQKGVEFGEYSLCQYRYAKEYYRIFMEER